jgi:hypothetical protein
MKGDVFIYLYSDGQVLYSHSSFGAPSARAALMLRVRNGEVSVLKDRRVLTPIVAKKTHLGVVPRLPLLFPLEE